MPENPYQPPKEGPEPKDRGFARRVALEATLVSVAILVAIVAGVVILLL